MTQPTIHDPRCRDDACAIVSAIIPSELEDQAVTMKRKDAQAVPRMNHMITIVLAARLPFIASSYID